MDQYLSTVIIALITGIFSIITLIIQRKQDKVITKIDEQTTFIDREKNLKQRLIQKEKERDLLIHDMMILILETNIYILQNTDVGKSNTSVDKLYTASDALKKKFNDVNAEIEDINDEYTLVLDITSEFQKEINKSKGNN